MSEKGIPVFDGRGEAYWWLIQLDRFFEAKNWIHDERKMMWVTLFALRGEAFKWWSSWKQDHQNATWEIFERGLIQEFIPDLWEMLQAAEEEEQENNNHELNVVAESEEKSECGEDGTDSGFLKASTNLVPSSEPSNRKLQATTTEIQVAGGSAALPPPPKLSLLAKPSLLAEPTRNTLPVNLASVVRSIEGGSQITQRSFAHKPPPKPPDPNLLVAAMETVRADIDAGNYGPDVQVVQQLSHGPKIWKVYTRRGKQAVRGE